MGKRSDKPKIDKDRYFTPRAGVSPLLPWLPASVRYIEPCGGDGRLARFLDASGHDCVHLSDIDPSDIFMLKGDALEMTFPDADMIITNPPWSRGILHKLIRRFLDTGLPVWLLYDADWKYTDQKGQVAELIKHCSHIVAIGRLKWFEDSDMTGKDNSAWYRFHINHATGPKFYHKGYEP